MSKLVDGTLIALTAMLYALGYFFRGSVAPITDVLEIEFNATSSQIGFMSSLFWFGYMFLQVPSGILLQKLNTEFIVLISAFLFMIASGLFGLPFNEGDITLPSIIMLISGAAAAPLFLAICTLISQRLGHHYLPFIGGIVFFATAIFLFSANLLQAYLFQEFEIWRPVFWVLSIIVIIIFITVYLLSYMYRPKKNQTGNLSKPTPKPFRSPMIRYDDHIPNGHATKTNNERPMSNLSVGVKDTDRLLSDPDEGREPVFCCGVLVRYKSAIADPDADSDDLSVKRRSLWKSMKSASVNPWNYVLGFHWFSVAAIMISFNGLWLISYMSIKFGYSRELSTTISGTFYIAHAFGNIIFGKLSTKFQKKKVFFIICAVLLLSPIFIIYCHADTNMYVIILMNILSGFGTGVPSIVFAFVREYNDYYECSDIAGGIVNTMASASGFIVQWLIGVLIDYNWESRDGDFKEDGERDYSVSDYNLGFVTILIVIGMNVSMTLVLKETNGKKVQWDESKGCFRKFVCF